MLVSWVAVGQMLVPPRLVSCRASSPRLSRDVERELPELYSVSGT